MAGLNLPCLSLTFFPATLGRDFFWGPARLIYVPVMRDSSGTL
jgi:hypothetical protein